MIHLHIFSAFLSVRRSEDARQMDNVFFFRASRNATVFQANVTQWLPFRCRLIPRVPVQIQPRARPIGALA